MAVTADLSMKTVDQSTEHNYTIIKVTVGLRWTYSSHDLNSGTATLTVDGKAFPFDRPKINPNVTSTGSDSSWFTTNVTVYHDDDGTKKGVVISVLIPTSTESGTVRASITRDLVTIPRATQPSVSPPSVALGGSTTISTPRASSAFTHTLTYKIGDVSETIATGVGTSYSWEVPLSLANQLPNSTSGTVTITCYTYNGSSHVGTKTASLTVTVPASVKPTVSGINISEAVAAVTSKFGLSGKYVKTLSQLMVEVSTNTTDAYGATVKNYSTVVDGITYPGQQFTSNVLTGAGTLTVTTTITDSRERTSTLTKNITVLDYARPAINLGVSISGTKVTATMKGKVFDVNSKNTKKLVFKYKKITDETYTQRTITLAADEWEFTKTSIVNNIDPEVAYEFVAELTDKIDTVLSTGTTGTVCISRLAGGKGVTFFGEAEEKGLVVKGETNPVLWLKATKDVKGRILKNVISEVDYGTFLQDYGANGASALRVVNKNEAIESRIQFVNTPVGGSNTYYNLLGTHNVADYVIEKGTKGIWTYVKWNNGRIEMWGDRDSSFPAGTSIGNGQYRSVLQLNLSAYMEKLIDGKCLYQNTGMIPQITRHGTNLNWAEIIIIRPAAIAAFSAKLPLHFTGLWK